MLNILYLLCKANRVQWVFVYRRLSRTNLRLSLADRGFRKSTTKECWKLRWTFSLYNVHMFIPDCMVEITQVFKEQGMMSLLLSIASIRWPGGYPWHHGLVPSPSAWLFVATFSPQFSRRYPKKCAVRQNIAASKLTGQSSCIAPWPW